MRTKSIVLIVIALGCGLVASIGISQVLGQRGTGGAGVETVPVYVALADIDINEKLDASHVKLEDWPKDKVPPGALRKIEQVKGKFARVRLYQGEPLTQRKIADEVSNKSVDIPVGFRVSSVKVQMDTAVSFLIQPGDRVDIIATFHRSADIPQTMTMPILRNVRVFAVNSETETEVENGKPIVAKTVSLLLKEDQDEVLSLASEMGSLRLSLRNPKEKEGPEDTAQNKRRITLEELLSGKTGDGDQGNGDKRVGTSGLLGMLVTRPRSEPRAELPVSPRLPEPPKEKWRMTVLSADGTSTYVWHDEKEAPRLAEPEVDFASSDLSSEDEDSMEEDPEEESVEDEGPFDE